MMKKKLSIAIYANRLPFRLVECPLFNDALEALRPGVGGANKKLLTERELAGPLLDQAEEELDVMQKKRLQGQNVVLCQDGWSNIRR